MTTATYRLPRAILPMADVIIDGRTIPGSVAHRVNRTTIPVPRLTRDGKHATDRDGKQLYDRLHISVPACQPVPKQPPGPVYLELSAGWANAHGAVACTDPKCWPEARR